METRETNHADNPSQNLNYNKYARFLKVTLKMFGLAFRKYIPFKSGKNSIEDIFNYINYNIWRIELIFVLLNPVENTRPEIEPDRVWLLF